MRKTLPHTLMDRWGSDLQAEQRTDADTTDERLCILSVQK